MNITMPEEPANYYAESDPAEFRLESYLISKNIKEIGDRNAMLAWYEKTNYKRCRQIEMSDAERIFRTRLILKTIDEEKLINWHNNEEKAAQFLYPDLFKKKDETETLNITPIEFRKIVTYQNYCRPVNQKFHGFDIPPYFIYDLDFDGFKFHREWDKKIFDKKAIFQTMYYDEKNDKWLVMG
jgi:hypothetical protein